MAVDDDNHTHLYPSSFDTNQLEHDDSLILLERIPDFLLSTHSLFRCAYFNWINKIDSPVRCEQLEQLTILVYQMAMIHLRQELWQLYLQSGTGQLPPRETSKKRSPHLTLHLWPKELTMVIMGTSASQIHDQSPITHETYEDFVKKHLAALEEQFNLYRAQFESIKTSTNHYHETINDEIERFVQTKALPMAKLYFEARRVLIQADYNDRFYQLEYLHQKSTLEQVSFSISFRLSDLRSFRSIWLNISVS